MKTLLQLNIQNILAMFTIIFSSSIWTVQANPMGIPQAPQIPAFLPMAMDVPMTDKLPIDGEWMINDIRKRIRIEGGRAYAVDSWLHLFVLKIEPMMVVSQDWRRTDPGQYSGQDLPLVGSFTASLASNGYLNMRIQGLFGPVNLTLSPVRLDDQDGFEREKAGEESYPEEDEYIEYEEEYVDDEEYFDDDYIDDEEYFEEAVPTKIKAKRYKKAKKSCEGKQVYRSGTKCYACPTGYKRTSPTRKMTHPQACKERGLGLGKDKVKAKYVWGANGCPKYQFKYKGYCMKCPKGSKRIHVSGVDTGYCKIQ